VRASCDRPHPGNWSDPSPEVIVVAFIPETPRKSWGPFAWLAGSLRIRARHFRAQTHH
jgi:hypothetical protein